MQTLNLAGGYGSDRHGLICGFLFAAGSTVRAVSLDEARAGLARPDSATAPAFVWLHFNLADASAERWMRSELALAPAFFDALHEGSRSTRIEDAADHLIAVVNDVAYEFSFEPSEIATLWMAVGPRLAVSARTHPLRSIDRLRQAVKDGGRFGSSMALLNHLLDDQGDVLVRIVREATLQVDAVEDSLPLGRLQRKRAELGKLRRLLVRLQRLLAPEPGALLRLLRQPPPRVRQARPAVTASNPGRAGRHGAPLDAAGAQVRHHRRLAGPRHTVRHHRPAAVRQLAAHAAVKAPRRHRPGQPMADGHASAAAQAQRQQQRRQMRLV